MTDRDRGWLLDRSWPVVLILAVVGAVGLTAAPPAQASINTGNGYYGTGRAAPDHPRAAGGG